VASRLRTLAPRVNLAPSRIGRAPRHTGSTPKRERNNVAWRAWYSSKAWHELRLKVFERDGYVCQRTGVICAGKHPAPDSPTANHKVRHNGDPALFWNPDNVETVTKEVHDTVIQAEEAKAYALGNWG